jgi:uncharacterized protein YukE
MDVEAAQQLSQSMASNADSINQAAASLTSQLHSVQWIGADGDTFRNDWDGTYHPQLNNIVTALQDRSTHVSQEAQQQLDASGS